jgi:pyruvate/2-oxoglutarate dehydrogenase complex dihydrolipoamide dehydrogenase (E3) component
MDDAEHTVAGQVANFDLIVLGMSPGAELLAEDMASAGWSVLGVDPRLVGGECPYFGCIPSKMVIRGAEVLAEGRRVNGMAGSAVITPDYTPVGDRIRNEATDDWNDQAAVDRFTGKGGVFARGAGRLTGRLADGRLGVEVAGVPYAAKRVVISTGTAPAVPPIPGLAELRGDDPGPDGLVWTNREILRVRTAPPSLLVIGGGAVGIELTQAFGRFGTRVTVIEAGPRILGPEEPEASAVVTDVLRREGVDVRTGVHVSAVAAGGEGVELTLDTGETLTAARVLVAAGRRPNLDIGLASVGLDDNARTLDVDATMRVQLDGAPIDGLFAVGDITGRGAFTHVSVFQATVLTALLLDRPRYYDGYDALAWVTFTDPEVGRVGPSEAQARERGHDVQVASVGMAESTRGWIHGPGNDGVIKLVADRAQGVLVGATVVGPAGGEILGLLTLAVHAKVPLATLASMHYAYPTLHRGVLAAVQKLLP